MSRDRSDTTFWQSYSDLAMGLVGVFALILILLLITEQQTARKLETDREQFASELIELLDQSQKILEHQDLVQSWLDAVFEEGDCQLLLTEQGHLSRRGFAGEPAQLYDSGSVSLQPEAERALESCSRNLFRLAICLSPGPEAREQCRNLDAEGSFADQNGVREAFRDGIEALVLQGNTDRQRYLQSPPIRRQTGGYSFDAPATQSFVDNAFLGSERARQALAHLLLLLEQHGRAETDPLQIMMSRVRVESPSFGRYQAGPPTYENEGQTRTWREGDCQAAECAEARNLSLILRWRKEALREPYLELRRGFCRLLSNSDSVLYQGLLDSGKDPEAYRAKVCSETES